MTFLAEALELADEPFPFQIRVMRDEVGRFFCQVVGFGMFDTIINFTLPYKDAQRLAEAIVDSKKYVTEIR